jgi:hypothetical protein
VWDADIPEALVADEMGRRKTFTSFAAAMLCHLVTEEVVMGLPLTILWGNTLEEHQQNVNRSRSNMETSQTLRHTSMVLPSNSRFFQAPRELCKVLGDSARAFSGAPETTCSYEGAFRMLRDLTYRIVLFWSCRDLCAGPWET